MNQAGSSVPVDMHRDWPDKLRESLNSSWLPESRQRERIRFSPDLSYGRHFGPPTSRSKMAAVMILIEPRQQGWTIPLTVRPDHLPDHPGQISFPGGRLEGEETFRQAAEREFNEELGTPSFPGHVLGELQPIYVFNSDYYVRPFVAWCPNQNEYEPCGNEVARIVHLPLATLLDPQSHVVQPYSRGSVSWNALAIQSNQDQIWGATAIMLGELKAVLEDSSIYK